MKKICLLMSFLGTFVFGQVGIGTSSPDSSSLLHVDTNNKGILLNKASIISTVDDATIPETKSGMLLYTTDDFNLGSNEEILKDYVYLRNATKWVKLLKGTELDSDIAALQIPSFGMYVYSKEDFALADSSTPQDVTYDDATSDSYFNPNYFQRVDNKTFKVLNNGVVMMDGFMNITQNATDISWGMKILVSSDNGANWSPAVSKANYCNHPTGAFTISPLTCTMQESFSLNTNDLIKVTVIKRVGSINTSARLDASVEPGRRYSSGFKAIFFPTNIPF